MYFARILLQTVPKAQQEMVAADLRSVFTQQSAAAVEKQWDQVEAMLTAIDQALLLELARATRHLRAAWSFTHFPMGPANQATIQLAAAKGLVVNASTESRSRAAKFHHEGVRFVACPASRSGPLQLSGQGPMRLAPVGLDPLGLAPGLSSGIGPVAAPLSPPIVMAMLTANASAVARSPFSRPIAPQGAFCPRNQSQFLPPRPGASGRPARSLPGLARLLGRPSPCANPATSPPVAMAAGENDLVFPADGQAAAADQRSEVRGRVQRR
jgi:hypothetical protein